MLIRNALRYGAAPPPATGFAHLGVRFTQDYSLEWAAATLPAAAMMLFQLRCRGNGSSFGKFLTDNRGTLNKVLAGSDTLDATHDAEHPQGAMPFAVDNSAGSGGGTRRAAVGDANILTNNGYLASYSPPDPSIRNNEYFDWIVAVDVAHANGAKLGAMAIDGVQVSVFAEGGTWGSSTIANNVGKWMINVYKAGAGGVGPADVDIARHYCTRLSSVANILDPTPGVGFATGFLAKMYTAGVGAVDLGASGIIAGVTTPNAGNAPDFFNEVRPGGVATDFETNRGLLGGNPTRGNGSGSVNTALKVPYLATVHPEEKTGDQPFIVGIAWQPVSLDNGTFALDNYGIEIRVNDLILPWFGSGGTGPRAALAAASPNGAYAILAGTTTGDDFTIWRRTATAADVTANGKEWSTVNTNARPTITWTAGPGWGGGGSNAVAGVLVLRKPSGNAITSTTIAPVKQTFAIATPPTAGAITPPTATPGLLMDFLKAYGWQYEGNLTPPAGVNMIPSFKRGGDFPGGGGGQGGAWPYMWDKRVNQNTAIAARAYATTVNGNPGVILSAVFT